MLTFQELFSSPPFSYAEIISSRQGLERTIEHVQSSTSNLEAASVMVLPNYEEYILQLTDYLTIDHVEGIILHGDGHLYLSPEEIKSLKSFHKPIIYVSGVSEEKILSKINELLTLKNNGLAEYIWNDTSSYWLELAVNHGIKGILSRLKEFVGENILLVNRQFQPHFPDEKLPFSTPLNTIKTLFYQKETEKVDHPLKIQDTESEYFIFSIREKDNFFGYLIFQESSGLETSPPISIKHIQYAMPALTANFKKDEAVFEAHRMYQDEFLLNLLQNNMESEQDLINQGKRWGWDFTRKAQLMVMQIEPLANTSEWKFDMDAMMSHIRSTLTSLMLSPIVFKFQAYIVIIVFNSFSGDPYDQKNKAIHLGEMLLNSVAKFQPNTGFQIGIGRHYPSNLDLHRSFYEAKTTLELAKSVARVVPVRHFEDMKIARLLSNIHHSVLQEFYEDVLRPIVDDRDTTIETLDAYFNNNGDIAITAENLYIHANTLRKRIKKIETTLDVDFNQYEDLFQVFTALKIMKMIN